MSDDKLPSITAQSFECPHCGALAHQTWYTLYVTRNDDNRTPTIWTDEIFRNIYQDNELRKDMRDYLEPLVKQYDTKLVFFHDAGKSCYSTTEVCNLYLSRCYSCEKITVWVHGQIVFPAYKIDIHPHNDMPDDIAADFIEAAKIISHSPRGAAALARLCIQKLCIFLGEDGKNINNDIASLVKKGLNEKVQKALDVVRVVGNNAVHPGVIDIRDDRGIALRLLQVVNMIVERMIKDHKEIDDFFENLPDSKKEQIKRRDKKSE